MFSYFIVYNFEGNTLFPISVLHRLLHSSGREWTKPVTLTLRIMLLDKLSFGENYITLGDFKKFLDDLEQKSGHGLALIDFLWGKN